MSCTEQSLLATNGQGSSEETRTITTQLDLHHEYNNIAIPILIRTTLYNTYVICIIYYVRICTVKPQIVILLLKFYISEIKYRITFQLAKEGCLCYTTL